MCLNHATARKEAAKRALAQASIEMADAIEKEEEAKNFLRKVEKQAYSRDNVGRSLSPDAYAAEEDDVDNTEEKDSEHFYNVVKEPNNKPARGHISERMPTVNGLNNKFEIRFKRNRYIGCSDTEQVRKADEQHGQQGSFFCGGQEEGGQGYNWQRNRRRNFVKIANTQQSKICYQ